MIIFSGHTALAYWFWIARTNSSPALPVRKIQIPDSYGDSSEILDECRLFADDQNDVCVLSSNKSVRRSRIRSQQIDVALPSYSFCKIRKDVYVVSPELSFVLASRERDFVSLVKLGYELTARYVLSDELFHDGFVGCTPITNKSRLKKYVDRISGVKAVKLARSAVGHVIQNSASPMETELMMVLTLPRRYGGYGLPKPALNVDSIATKRQLEDLRRAGICPDACWAKDRLILEYDSDAYHVGAEKIARDSMRRNDIMRLGYDVVTVTNPEYKSGVNMDRVYEVVRKRLGLRRQSLDPLKQHALKNALLNLRSPC